MLEEQLDTPTAGKPSTGAEAVNRARKFGEDEARRRNEKSGSMSPEGKDRYSDDDPLAYNRAAGRTAETYLPAGTFVRASLLNGLDAPTGGMSQQNPHPVLLRLEDNAQLPNAVRANLKGCVVTGNGHGDMSSVRAIIRLDRLSCVDDTGGAIDVAVKGYVAGEDGKTGLRGRMVTKTGQVLANAITVGLLGGFGEALRQGAVSTNTGLGTGVQTQTINNSLEYGIGTGLGKAMDRVAQYYIKLADKLFPIVEIDGGRVVDIVLTRGVSIERK
jgi:conjugal transfer pilus assembly protein TraB